MKILLLSILLSLTTFKSEVVFVGDSYSAGVNTSYNYLLAKEKLNWRVTHIVKIGSSTSWMLKELDRKLYYQKYDVVFIYGGINDLYNGGSVTKTIKNIQAMVDMVTKQGGTAYVIVGFGGEFYDKCCNIGFRNRYIDYQTRLKSEIANTIIIPSLNVSSDLTARDKLHPLPEAQKKLKNHILNYVK